jgi:hypothetical protein
MDIHNNRETLGYFQDSFEGLEIHIHQVEINEFSQVNDGVFMPSTPFSGVWENIGITGMPYEKNLIGKIMLLLKSQHEKSKMGLFITFTGIAKANAGDKTALIVCKYIQYLFEWTKKYAEENHLKDKEGNNFVVPEFLYSQELFEGNFKD